jgi:hypothetical protein
MHVKNRLRASDRCRWHKGEATNNACRPSVTALPGSFSLLSTQGKAPQIVADGRGF